MDKNDDFAILVLVKLVEPYDGYHWICYNIADNISSLE